MVPTKRFRANKSEEPGNFYLMGIVFLYIIVEVVELPCIAVIKGCNESKLYQGYLLPLCFYTFVVTPLPVHMCNSSKDVFNFHLTS